MPPISLKSRLKAIIGAYWHLGLTSFGGPGAHVVILERLFVQKLQWIDARTFADLFSISNALPGPGSAQIAFGIALVKYGELASMVAFLFWSSPGGLGMTALGFAVRKIPNELPPIVLAVLTGINAAAVGLIALAAYRLSLNTVTDRVTRLLLCLSAAIGLLYSSIWLPPYPNAGCWARQPSIVLSPRSSSCPRLWATTNGTTSHTHLIPEPRILEASVSVLTSISLLVFFACVFMSAAIFRAVVDNAPRIWDFGSNLFIGVGSIIFGGGAEYVVDPGWVSNRDFLFGFAMLQAFPGPNFNFSAYLGVLANPDNPVLGALTGLVALYSPGLILEFALLPFYVKLRESRIT
ncbi:hypothetical protein BS47DRAFT_1356809, partial [Hydnum rufescens UP504]